MRHGMPLFGTTFGRSQRLQEVKKIKESVVKMTFSPHLLMGWYTFWLQGDNLRHLGHILQEFPLVSGWKTKVG